MGLEIPLAKVFGGCCSNVVSFEELTGDPEIQKSAPNVGTTLTFFQFLLVSVVGLPSQLDDDLKFKRPHIPLTSLGLLVLLYVVVSVLNNSAWRFGISVPIHIVFRSSSTVMSMIVGYLVGGKTYSDDQILSCFLMTLGTFLVIAQGSTHDGDVTVDWLFITGILTLTVASLLGAYMGIYSEKLYKKHGNHWQEVLFYTHFLGLPMFLFAGPAVVADIRALWSSGPIVPGLPRGIALLAMNAVTQLICASGVNSLAGVSSSLTVAVILLVRKFASLALSSFLYGTTFSAQGMVGSLILVLSTIYYTIATMKAQKNAKKPKSKPA